MEDDKDGRKWKTAHEISQELKINRATVSHLARAHGLRVKDLGYRYKRYNIDHIRHILSQGGINQFNLHLINPVSLKSFTDSWKLDWDEFIFGADLHVPFIHHRILDRMLSFADKYKIYNFMHGGDFWDQNQFSQFDVYAEDLVEWPEEIECGLRLDQTLRKTFREVKYFMGSHDLRFWRMLNRSGKAAQYNSAFKMAKIDEENTSRYRYCEIGSEWHLTHPRNTIKINTAPALRLGAKVQRSIIIGHGHWYGLYKDPSGLHYQIAPGCLTDQNLHAYAMLWDTSHDKWTPGFVAVVDKNKPILLCEQSPWDIYLGKKGKG